MKQKRVKILVEKMDLTFSMTITCFNIKKNREMLGMSQQGSFKETLKNL